MYQHMSYSTFSTTMHFYVNLRSYQHTFRHGFGKATARLYPCLFISTLVYINYQILNPAEKQLSTIKDLISNFVRGNLNISREKIFLEEKYGGVGMIDLKDYLIVQQCAWLKRLGNGKDDIYKCTLRGAGYSSPQTEPESLDVFEN
jgi:hypothetical protein